MNNMEEKRKGCSFTGHRRIEPSHKKNIDGLIARAIGYAYGEGCRDFYCGGAVGFDTHAARQVILFRLSHPDVRLHLLLPCSNQDEKWNGAEKKRYEHTIVSADTVSYISDEYTKDCMKKRNEKLVEAADIVIAYVNKNYSGAAQTVRLANKAGKRVYNLYPTLEKEQK